MKEKSYYSEMSREKSLIKNMWILGIGTIIPKLTSIIILPIITAYLTKIEYGQYDLITILVSLFLPIATLEMQAAAFRYLIESRKDINSKKEIVTNIILFTTSVSIIALFALFFCMWKMDVKIRILITVYYFADIMVTTLRQIVRGLGNNVLYSISVLVNAIVELVLIVVLVQKNDKGLLGLLFAMIIAQLMSFSFLALKIKIYAFIDIKLVSAKKIKEMLNYSWPLIPNALSSWVMRVSDRLVISVFLGVEANAVYAVANKIPNLFGIVQSTFSLAWQENATMSRGDKDSAQYYTDMFESVFCFFVGMLAILISLTPLLFKLLIRGSYSEAYFQIPILLLSVFFSSISAYLGGIYIANKKSKEIGITTIIASVFNFLINILLIKHIGIYAASISTVLSYGGLTFFRMADIQKIVKIKFDYKKIIRLVFLLNVMCILCYLKNIYVTSLNICIAFLTFVFLNKSIVRLICTKIKNKKSEM